MLKVYAYGFIATDPKQFSVGKAQSLKFSIRTKKSYVREGESKYDYFNCEIIRNDVTNIAKYLKKGNPLIITDGEMRVYVTTDEAGNKVYHNIVRINDFEFVRNSNGLEEVQGTSDGPLVESSAKPAQPKPADNVPPQTAAWGSSS